MNGKIVALADLARCSQEWRAQGLRIVATNGCFDLLHVGHVRYLAAAAELGDLLVVGLNDDASVRALKGAGRPLNAADDRAEVLAALAVVACVAIFSGARATSFLEAAHPSVYTKGGDYTPETLDGEERTLLETLGTEIRIVPFTRGYSTTDILTKVSKRVC